MSAEAGFAGYATTTWGYSPVIGDTAVGRIEWRDAVKRGMDVALASVALVLTLPIWVLIALAVKWTSPGPVFFTQQRAGLHGRPFRMLKFRSMVADAEARLSQLVNIEDLTEPVYKLKDDPRVTRVGRFLRRFGLDELPQLINVLRGEMSLVGPRPEVTDLVERYDAEQRRRLLVKPGLTGYQQIHNRGMPDMAARLAYDLHYLRHRGAWLDLRILFMTVFVIASGREITY